MTKQIRANRASGAADTVVGLPEAYRRWRSSRLGRITDELEERLLLELIDPVEGENVLDIGCGDGMLATKLAHRGACVTGLDLDTDMLQAARCRAKQESVHLELVHGCAEALPFPTAAFDCVVAVTVLCFVEQEDQAIGEMARVLKPDGRLIIGELGKTTRSVKLLWMARHRCGR